MYTALTIDELVRIEGVTLRYVYRCHSLPVVACPYPGYGRELWNAANWVRASHPLSIARLRPLSHNASGLLTSAGSSCPRSGWARSLVRCPRSSRPGSEKKKKTLPEKKPPQITCSCV